MVVNGIVLYCIMLHALSKGGFSVAAAGGGAVGGGCEAHAGVYCSKMYSINIRE